VRRGDERGDSTTSGADTPEQDESDPIETTFELNDTLYAKAEVPPTDEVYLWLGVCAGLYPLFDGRGQWTLTDLAFPAGKRHAGVPDRRGG
jgi:hypothetical protein